MNILGPGSLEMQMWREGSPAYQALIKLWWDRKWKGPSLYRSSTQLEEFLLVASATLEGEEINEKKE